MKRIPIGIENFKKMIDKNAYYVDKTEFISDVFNEEFVLYTRPRRFGKTLNMSMLYYFFSNREKENAYLFDGLKITNNLKVMKHQNQYPTIFITLKDMKNNHYESQLYMFSTIIANILDQYEEMMNSHVFNQRERDLLTKYHNMKASEDELKIALLNISRYLFKYYHQKTIILIDEYDVPLQSAYANNYYEEMVDFLRSVFSSALKTNDSLEKGIMTGCLRIFKESIFTGLNNFNVYSILDYKSSECFGFTEGEVQQMLDDYHMSDFFDEVKEWYDGYLFGDTEIYNPWSTLMYIDKKQHNHSSTAESFWANTSSNAIVYDYISQADRSLRDEFEILMKGQSIDKQMNLELTYREMDDIDNIYSFLLLTGYLKIKEDKGNHIYSLVIPNKEVYEIYQQSFMKYFRLYTKARKTELYQKLVEGKSEEANIILNDILNHSISYYDNQENFYHGFLAGLFSEYTVESNRESGDGRFDICILPETILGTAIVIECKHSASITELLEDASKGAKQIAEKKYKEGIKNRGYLHVVGYGISFYKKQCYIVNTTSIR